MSTTFSMLLFAAITMICVSYAWGMRGDLIGGEEGAVLPGALLGFCIAFFLGGGVFDKFAFYFIALGMTGMFIGGTEPYAQAFDYTYWGCKGRKKPLDMKKGIKALAVKGGPWFGICAAVVSIGLTAAGSEKYPPVAFIVLFVLIPIVRAIGTKLFNDPHDPDKGIFPKIYFSNTSREEWGGLWFMLITFMVFELIFKDYSSFVITVFGTVGGSLGWIIAQLLNCVTSAEWNGKYIFGKYQKNGRVDNWKIMEFSYGALGSLSIVLGFICRKADILRLRRQIISSGITPSFDSNVMRVLFFIWFALLAADMLRYFVPAEFKGLVKVQEIMHRPILCYIPMLLLFLGNLDVAKFMAVVVLFWLAPEELCFVQLKRRYKITIPVIISYTALIGLIIFTFIAPDSAFVLRLYFPLMCLLYFFSASFMFVAAHYGLEGCPKSVWKLMKIAGSFIPVKMHYLFCIVFASVFFFLN